jgi:glycosyltransferase involved in cell wall biosynthesis
MNTPSLISIIVCTRDRAASLQPTLDSMRGLSIPTGWRLEVVVVDNGSTDSTRSLVEMFSANNFSTRYILEPQTGLAHARNRGLREASGEIIVFTDDDVRTPPGWLAELCSPLISGSADMVQGGVRIAPHLERVWLKGALRIWLASVEDPINSPQGLVGANFALHTQALIANNIFDTRLGAGATGFFEDTIFGWQLERAGYRKAYRPQAYVEHHFDSSRLCLSFYTRTARKMAASNALVIDAGLGKPQPATEISLLPELPGFIMRCLTQLWKLAWRKGPDAGFVVRYYRLCLWLALKREKAGKPSGIPAAHDPTIAPVTAAQTNR